MILPAATAKFDRFKVRHLVGVYLLVHLGLGIASGWLGWLRFANHPYFPFIYYIVGAIATCCWAAIRCDRLQISIGKIIGKLPQKPRWLRLIGLTVAVISFSIGSAVVLFGLLDLISPKLVRQWVSDDSFKIENRDPLVKQILAFITLVIVAPITEEFLFRGIVLHRWSERWGIGRALIVAAVLFGCLHAHPIGLSMFGLIMGLLYLRSQTLWVPIFCHGINNLFVFVAMLLPKSHTNDRLENPIVSIVSGTMMMGIAIVFLWRFIDRSFPRISRSE